jgi:hypothetical protein
MSLTWALLRSIVPIERLKMLLLTLGCSARSSSQASIITLESVSGSEILARYEMTDHEPEQSRRDDMESLGYILLYFLRGRLSWQELKGETKGQKYKLMMEKKATIGVDELCDKVPREFAVYMDHVRALKFEDKPNYSYLRKIFESLFVRYGFEYDNVFDWTIKRYLELQQQKKQPPP